MIFELERDHRRVLCALSVKLAEYNTASVKVNQGSVFLKEPLSRIASKVRFCITWKLQGYSHPFK